ncbi:MAG: DUF1287 domain-containing protein [Clostridia bacterium]|nr:DUF1287 domain-containing protein [Clostridia bacterium]
MLKKTLRCLIVIMTVILLIIIFEILNILGYIPKKAYSAEDFNIVSVKSEYDKNLNGIDDFTDIMLGARKDALNKPKYEANSYTVGGYPSDNIGVCTDVIWRAFQNAGYNLKDLIDEDIKNNVSLYPATNGNPDPNIDFRRVRNLKVFFERYATVLTNDIYKIEQWQAGDIVIFGNDDSHIGIISDKRNKKGIPYLIHNSGQPKREEDILELLIQFKPVNGHYRWDQGR